MVETPPVAPATNEANALKSGETRRIAVRLSTQISAAGALGAIVGVLARLITAGLLGPANYGLLRIAEVVQQYAGYADLGAKHAVARQVSLFLGRGDSSQAGTVASILFTWTLVSTAAVTVVLWGLYLAGVALDGLLSLPNLVVLSVVLVIGRLNTFLANYVRAHGQFDALGMQFFITAVAPPIVSLPVVYWWGVTGGLLGQLLVAVLVAINLLYFARPLRVFALRLMLPFRRTLELLKLSALLHVISISETLFETLELSLLAFFVSAEQVGIYGFAIGWMTMALSTLAGVRLVVERSMLLDRAAQGETVRLAAFRKYMETPLVLNLLFAGAALGMLFFAYDFAVRQFLPQFIPSMAVAQVLIFGQTIYAMTSFMRSYFSATDQLKSRLGLTLLGLGLNVVLDLAFLFNGGGMMGLALGSVISTVVYSLVLFMVGSRQINGNRRTGAVFALRLIVVAGLGAVVLYGLSTWQPAWSVVPGVRGQLFWQALLAALKMGLFAFATVSLYVIGFRSFGVWRELVRLGRAGLRWSHRARVPGVPCA